MTEQEQKGIPGWKPATKEDMSEDDWDRMNPDPRTEEEKQLTEGVIKQEQEEALVAEPIAALDFDLDIEQRRAYQDYARRDTFDVEMRDGKTIKYKRIAIPEMEYEELEDLWSQTVSKRNLDNQPLNQIQLLHTTRLWLDKLGEYYFLNTKTKKMMTPQERRNAKDQAHINKMLKSSFMRSNYDLGPSGKN